MCTYATFPVKRKSCYRKSELQIFLRISGSRIGAPTQYINMASPYKALQKVHETFRQVTQKLWATKTRDLDKLFITFHFLGFLLWTVSNLFFCCMKVKRIYKEFLKI